MKVEIFHEQISYNCTKINIGYYELLMIRIKKLTIRVAECWFSLVLLV